MHNGKTECGDKKQSDFDVEKRRPHTQQSFFYFRTVAIKFSKVIASQIQH